VLRTSYCPQGVSLKRAFGRLRQSRGLVSGRGRRRSSFVRIRRIDAFRLTKVCRQGTVRGRMNFSALPNSLTISPPLHDRALRAVVHGNGVVVRHGDLRRFIHGEPNRSGAPARLRACMNLSSSRVEPQRRCPCTTARSALSCSGGEIVRELGNAEKLIRPRSVPCRQTLVSRERVYTSDA
jgi:hypothetical protein